MRRLRPSIPIAVIPSLLALVAGLVVVATPASAASVPAAPKLRVATWGRDFFGLNWEDRSTNESGFRVQTRTPGSTWQTAREVPNTGSGQPGATGQVYGAMFENQPPPLEVCFRAVAWNAEGSSHSDSSCTVPFSPLDFKVTAETLTSVTLSWVDNSWNEDGFDLYQGYASDHEMSLIAHLPGFPDRGSVVTHTVTGLSSSIVYEFRVQAVNGVGASGYEVLTVRPG